MCGRFAFFSPHEAVRRLFLPDDAVPAGWSLPPRWNIAPTLEVAAVRGRAGGGRELAALHWGLVPSWAREPAIGARMINARAETLAEKPSFRAAFRKRRCLVLADGYYEWRAVAGGKQPYFIRLASAEPFGMAGLWESWRDPASDTTLESCVIVTRAATDEVLEIHDRMPVIVPQPSHAAWLDPATDAAGVLATVLADGARPALTAQPVSRRVNNPRNDGPELLEPAA